MRVCAAVSVSCLILVGLMLAGCAGGGSGHLAPAAGSAPTASPTLTPNAPASVRLSFTIPKRTVAASRSLGARKPNFVSPSSALATVVATGSTTVTTPNISLTAAGVCVTQGNGDQACTISAGAPVGSVSFQITISDANANVLSEGTASAQTIVEGTNNVVLPVVLGAAIATVAFGSVSYASSGAFVSGTANTATLYLTFADYDGNLVPAGAPLSATLSLTSSDPSVTFGTPTLTSVPASIALSYSGATVSGGTVTLTASGETNGPASFPIGVATTAMVTTLAGNGTEGFANGTAASAEFSDPFGIAVDSSGNVFVADFGNSIIREISGGTVSTYAGQALVGGHMDGPYASARFTEPWGITIAPAGVYVAENAQQDIRLLSGGSVTTVAGSGSTGFADGPALSAVFSGPIGLAVDTGGNVFVADQHNSRIREISAGYVSTFAGTGTNALTNGATGSAAFYYPEGVAIDASGNMYVADTGNNVIREISGGFVTTFAGTGVGGLTNGPAALAQFSSPSGIAVDASGNVYVADEGNHVIRKISGGQVSTLAGNGTAGDVNGPGTTAEFNDPSGIAVDTSGNVYVTEIAGATIRKITP